MEEKSTQPSVPQRETAQDAGDVIALSTIPDNKNISAVDEAGLGGLGEDAPEKDQERPSEGVQVGVQDVEAVTLTWSRTSLVAVFILYDDMI